jgi:hypothetical protein
MWAVSLYLLVIGAVVGGAVVAVREWRRYRVDRSPRPPLSADEREGDPFHTGVAVLIAAVSVAGAVLAFQASTVFGDASELSGRSIQERTQLSKEAGFVDTKIDFGARLATIYQEHLRTVTELERLAAAARAAGDGPRAQRLEADLRVERAATRVIDAGFLGPYRPDVDDGAVTYDRERLRAREAITNPDLRTLDPAATQAEAERARRKGLALLGVGALFGLVLLLLTVTNLGPVHRRLRALVPAVALTAVAFALLAGTGS